ncbi:MAG: hypothetical protein JSV35_04335 [Candidatus Bathyarchaeota archaeon]|nr:MAG: hypothetical protein JSV35_04335 [Candidatus Bathyarchaeota archaeon]
MPAPKWLIVAKNEYRIHTSSMRSLRRIFPYIAVGLLAVYVVFLAPAIFSYFFDDFTAFIITQAAAPTVQLVLFMLFFYFIIFPITNTLREEQTDQLEIFLAAPVKPSDVLLGEFLGVMPFYGIVVVVLAGSFTALLTPLGLDLAQIVITIAVFCLTFFSALWIGTVTAAILRSKLGKSARGKDIGKALAMIIALPLVAVMYALLGGGLLSTLTNPNISGIVRTVLNLIPSSWGAEVFVHFASNPGNILAVGWAPFLFFGGLSAFFLAVLFLGVKGANRAYSLETTSFTASRAKPDGVFYQVVRILGGSDSFGTLLVSLFKDYGRRLENLSKIIYMVGLLIVLNLFLIDPTNPEGGLVMMQFILPLLSVFIVGEVTLRGKGSLFIYKKAPSGVGRLVKARLLKGWLIVMPISLIAVVATAVTNPAGVLSFMLFSIGMLMSTVAASVAFVLGLFLLNPAFSDKSGNYMVNIMITMQVLPIGTFLVPMIIFRTILQLSLYDALLYFTVPFSWILGILILYLGKRRLSRIE